MDQRKVLRRNASLRIETFVATTGISAPSNLSLSTISDLETGAEDERKTDSRR
jgi:hypothetical protein